MKVFTTFLHIALFKYSRSTEKEQKRLIIITMQQILIPRDMSTGVRLYCYGFKDFYAILTLTNI